MPVVPHFRLPMRLLPSGDFETIEQDTTAEVAQHAAAILRTPHGSRMLRPTLGLIDTTHDLTDPDGSETLRLIEEQLAEHEPRAEHHAAAQGATMPEWIERVTIDITGVAAHG